MTESKNIGLKEQLYRIVFEADTRAGKLFDVLLLWAILISVTASILQSVGSINREYGTLLNTVEWVFTGFFSLEYLLRIAVSRNRLKYLFSFMGLIDLCAVLPSWLGLLAGRQHHFLVVRIIRLLRVFRIFKLSRYVREAELLLAALRESRRKIMVFFGAVVILVVIMGSLIYSIEGEANGFTSIPRSIYWAVVTLTTVGYGDLAPKTVAGQFLSSLIMIIGYSIIAVPTGLVSVSWAKKIGRSNTLEQSKCPGCGWSEHDCDAAFCKRCGTGLSE